MAQELLIQPGEKETHLYHLASKISLCSVGSLEPVAMEATQGSARPCLHLMRALGPLRFWGHQFLEA